MLHVVELTKRIIFDDENGSEIVFLQNLAHKDDESEIYDKLDLENRDLMKMRWKVVLDGQEL